MGNSDGDEVVAENALDHDYDPKVPNSVIDP